jgi:hypothetical protein
MGSGGGTVKMAPNTFPTQVGIIGMGLIAINQDKAPGFDLSGSIIKF